MQSGYCYETTWQGNVFEQWPISPVRVSRVAFLFHIAKKERKNERKKESTTTTTTPTTTTTTATPTTSQKQSLSLWFKKKLRKNCELFKQNNSQYVRLFADFVLSSISYNMLMWTGKILETACQLTWALIVILVMQWLYHSMLLMLAVQAGTAVHDCQAQPWAEWERRRGGSGH